MASVPPHMRKATMQTEGLSRMHRKDQFATERNVLGVIGETADGKSASRKENSKHTGIDPGLGDTTGARSIEITEPRESSSPL